MPRADRRPRPWLWSRGSSPQASPNSAQALASFALRLQTSGYNIALAFFGCYGLSLGYLIWNSTFLPRVLGVLMTIAGLCYPSSLGKEG